MEQSGNPNDVTNLEDPQVDASGMTAEVGAASVATVQAPTLGTRGQLHAARFERCNRDAAGAELHELLLNPPLSGASDYEPGSDSDGASVGAPTRAHHRNDQPAASFDMNAFARACRISRHSKYMLSAPLEGKLRRLRSLASPNGMLRRSPSTHLHVVL